MPLEKIQQTSNQQIPTNPYFTTRRATIIGWILAVFAFIGILDAGYLTMEHYFGFPLPCSILDGCHAVTSSQYSTMLGVPIALFGLIFYITIFILFVAFLESKKAKLARYMVVLTSLSLIASGILVYLQIFVIKQLCLYCMISALNTVVLFAGTIYLRYTLLKDGNAQAQTQNT